MIYVQIDEDDFIDRMNRAHESTTHGFSHEGLKALFKYIEEEAKYNDTELDPIAISCDFVEYKNIDEAIKDYDMPAELNLKSLIGSYCKDIIRLSDGSVIIGRL
jgi:hypothetical protein